MSGNVGFRSGKVEKLHIMWEEMLLTVQKLHLIMNMVLGILKSSSQLIRCNFIVILVVFTLDVFGVV